MRVPRRLMCAITATSLIVLAHAAPNALARNNGQWENSPAHIRQWFQGLRQPDNPRVLCCGEADAYEADLFEIDEDRYVAIITDGKGEIPNGTKIPVPNHKMKWDEGNPTGHGIIFIGSQGQVFSWQDRKTGGHGRSSGVPAQRRCGLHDRTVGRGQRRSDHDSLTARAVID